MPYGDRWGNIAPFSRVPTGNCVVKGRKGRFPAHFLSFPLIPVGHGAGCGAEWGPMEGFWWYWRAGERVWGSEVRGVGKWALGWLSPVQVAGWIWVLVKVVWMGEGLEQGGSVVVWGFWGESG